MVLAIAGLIFLVVFLALPALQKSQRDTARRQDVARIVSALQSYEADNQGQLPANSSGWGFTPDGSQATGFIGYVGKLSQINYVWLVAPGQPYHNENNNTALIFEGMKCPGSNGIATASDAAVNIHLESSGWPSDSYCLDL